MSDAVAVVTGGTGLIGRACTAALAGAGYRVVAVDRNPVSLREVADARDLSVETLECDITSDDASRELWSGADWADSVEVLVCVAGGLLIPAAPFEEYSSKDFERVLALNLTAVWRWAALASPSMRRRGRGRLITFTSDSVCAGFPGGMAPYVAAKAGVVGLTRTLARELGEHGITVNSISPGLVPDKGGVKERAATSAWTSEGQAKLRQQWHALQTVPGDIEPQDIADAVTFLASDAAKRVNGQIIHIDSGSYCGD